MNKGISLHIGINGLSSHYQGTNLDTLNKSIASAKIMRDIAKVFFLDSISETEPPNPLLADEPGRYFPTVDNVRRYVLGAAKVLRQGDIFLLTYSGHGSQMRFPDTPEEDGFDETWCLYDRQFFDDEILELLAYFKPGVRILLISDSCHSGTIVSKLLLNNFLPLPDWFNFSNLDRKLYMELGKVFESEKFKSGIDVGKREIEYLEKLLGINRKELIERIYSLPRTKSLSKVLADNLYRQHGEYYSEIISQARERLKGKLPEGEKSLDASLIQISACKDDETTVDGVFTSLLRDVWKNKNPKDYCDFQTKISSQLPNNQHIGFETFGKDTNLTQKFLKQKPFTVSEH